MRGKESKLKQANRKFKHEQKRRQKTFAEKRRLARAVEHRGQRKNLKRIANTNYVNSLEAELLN